MNFIEEAIKLMEQGRGPGAGQTPMATTTLSPELRKKMDTIPVPTLRLRNP